MRGAGGGDDMQGERPERHCQGFYLTQKGFPDCVVVVFFQGISPCMKQLSQKRLRPGEPYMALNKRPAWKLI